MPFDVAYAKQHWHYLAGGLVGLLVLYYIYEKAKGGTAAAPAAAPDLSGGSPQLLALSASASQANAQVNAAVETAQLQAEVATNGIAAQLQSNTIKTAAELAATQQKTSADTTVALGAQNTQVQLAHITADAQVKQTQIEGATLETLGATAAQRDVILQQSRDAVSMSAIAAADRQVTYGITHDTGHVASYLDHITPVILAETGQGGAAAQVSANNTAAKISGDQTTASVVHSVSSGISSIFSGLFN